MASITLKDIPEDLHAQLKREGEANFRSMTQEVMARIQQSFEVQDHASTDKVTRLIDEAIASGAAKEFSPDELRARFDQTRQNTRRHLAADKRAA
jgi:hypothetical protein